MKSLLISAIFFYSCAGSKPCADIETMRNNQVQDFVKIGDKWQAVGQPHYITQDTIHLFLITKK